MQTGVEFFLSFNQLPSGYPNTALEVQTSGKPLCRPDLQLEIVGISLQNLQGRASSAEKSPSDPLKTCKKMKKPIEEITGPIQQGCVLWVGNVEKMELEGKR